MERVKKLNGFDGDYEITTQGLLINKKNGKILKCTNGMVQLKTEKGYRMYSLGRLVLENFIGHLEKKHVVVHLDGNKCNNRLHNLTYVSYSKVTGKPRRMVNQYHNGIFLCRHDSITKAAKENNTTPTAILASIYRNGTCCGFKFSFAE